MKMHMSDCLAAMAPAVRNYPITVAFQLLYLYDLTDRIEYMRVNPMIVYIVQRRIMRLGDYEDMHRRLWTDVVKRRRKFILVNYIGLNLLRCNPAE
jgi:hypothetical protein